MSEVQSSPLLFEIDGNIAYLTLNRPAQLNAINGAMRSAFKDTFMQIADDDTISVVVIRAAGPRAFSSGADMKEIGNRTPMQRRVVALGEAPAIVRACEKPVIAAMRGYAFGGGLELALACDMRLASETAVFCFPEITRGWFPLSGGTQMLPRLVGMGKAMELILTGRRITAREALGIGLVNSVHEDAGLDAAAEALAREIAGHSAGALILAKAAMRMSERAGTDVGYLYEREAGAVSYTLAGRAAALAAFAEARGKAK